MTHKIQKLTFRKITIPNNIVPLDNIMEECFDWIKDHAQTPEVKKTLDILTQVIGNFPMIRKLSYGARVHDVMGLATTWFDYCVQDSAGEGDIRSLIFQEDGHLYTTWNSKASILF